jgi:RNA polymerase sigma-70 factor (ECF subfamily)
MEELARIYWPPLYAYLRRTGATAADAEDLTQAFFGRLIEHNDLKAVDAAKGRFRSFVLASLKHFVANQRDHANAKKRGGGVRILSLDRSQAESDFQIGPADAVTPEKAFHRRWALTLLNRVVKTLQAEYRKRNQQDLFDALHGTLTGELTAGYAALGEKLAMSEGALQVAAHRLRKRYRQLLRDEIAQTVSDPALVDEEMRELLVSL